MNEKEAINVLIQAAVLGQERGVYSLKDAAVIFSAINKLSPNYFGKAETVEDEKKEQGATESK